MRYVNYGTACLLLSSVMLSTACRSKLEGSDAAPNRTVAKASPTTGSIAVIPPLPVAPLTSRKRSTLADKTLPAIKIAADAYSSSRYGHFVRVPVPDEVKTLPRGLVDAASIEVVGPSYGVAVPAGEGRLPDRPWLYVRFPKHVSLPERFTVRWMQPPNAVNDRLEIQEITVTDVHNSRPKKQLGSRFFTASARWLRVQGYVDGRLMDPFSAFARGRLLYLADKAGSPIAAATLKKDYSSVEEMALFRSVPLDLQFPLFNLGLGQPASGATESADVSLLGKPNAYSIRPRVVPQPKAQELGISKLLNTIPSDAAVLAGRASQSLGHLERLIMRMQQIVGPLINPMGIESGLRLPTPGPVKLDEVALASLAQAARHEGFFSRDFLLGVGADVTRVVQLKAGIEVKRIMRGWFERQIIKNPNIERKTISIGGIRAERILGWNKGQSLYWLQHGATLFLSNRIASIEAGIGCARSPEGCLTTDPHFVANYRSALAEGASEEWFAYIGPKGIDRQISSRGRIRHLRYRKATSTRQARDFEHQLYRWLNGRDAPKRSGQRDVGIVRLDLKQNDFGTRLSWRSIDGVTATEWASYTRFLERWRQNRKFVQPVLITPGHNRDGIDVRIEELIPLTPLRAFVESLEPLSARPQHVSGLNLALDLKKQGNGTLGWNQKLKGITQKRDVSLKWMGSPLVLGFMDSPGLLDAAREFLIPTAVSEAGRSRLAQRKKILRRIPVYLAIPIKEMVSLKKRSNSLK